MTSAVRRVFSYLGPDQVAEGFYTFDGTTLQMVFANGDPVELDGDPVTETGFAPDLVEAIAKRLTRRIRKALRGETVEGFGRRIAYEDEVFV